MAHGDKPVPFTHPEVTEAQALALVRALGVSSYVVWRLTKDTDLLGRINEMLGVAYHLGELIDRTIDCDADPFVPDGWMVEEHYKGGQIDFYPAKMTLHLDDVQKEGGVIVGNDLRKSLQGKQVMSACVLDFLLKNNHLIPDSWKGQHVFFWGTIYRHGRRLIVRCLCRSDGRWRWRNRWLNRRWDFQSPAAVQAS